LELVTDLGLDEAMVMDLDAVKASELDEATAKASDAVTASELDEEMALELVSASALPFPELVLPLEPLY
jgi:hypothetical protein